VRRKEGDVGLIRADKCDRLALPPRRVAGQVEQREPRRLQRLIAPPRHSHRHERHREQDGRADGQDERPSPVQRHVPPIGTNGPNL